jgi:hypothetical protein
MSLRSQPFLSTSGGWDRRSSGGASILHQLGRAGSASPHDELPALEEALDELAAEEEGASSAQRLRGGGGRQSKVAPEPLIVGSASRTEFSSERLFEVLLEEQRKHRELEERLISLLEERQYERQYVADSDRCLGVHAWIPASRCCTV